MITSPYELTTADRVEIHELPGRYGDAIDDRDWAKLDTVFTQDAVFDLTGVGSRVCNGLDDIKAFMESEAAHPRTHMMTNVYAESDEHGNLQYYFKTRESLVFHVIELEAAKDVEVIESHPVSYTNKTLPTTT